MNRTAEIFLEYLPPHKAYELVTRLSAHRPHDAEEARKADKEIFNDLNDASLEFLQKYPSITNRSGF